ncbi:MAG: VanZ family protein [candidate division WOR-3 bacterium]|nr:VanZ family protein [candidate division WOR-3 bacterium]
MRRFAFIIWLIILFITTSIPIDSLSRISLFGFDKLSHLFLYSVLTLFFFFDYGKKNWKFFPLIVLLSVVDEIHQYYIPGRTMSFYDLLFDLLGGGFTFWVLKS